MVKILEVGKPKREKVYYAKRCGWCQSKLVFERGDVWFDDPGHGIARIECPICKTKIFFTLPVAIEPCLESNKETYDNAHRDASKRGIEILMEEKKKEDAER